MDQAQNCLKFLYFAGKFPNNNKKRKYINEIYDEGDKKRRANSFTTTGAFKMNFNNASSLSRSFPITSSKNNQNSFLILNDNKFDIDNIVIPYEMLTNNSSNVVVLNKEILTPKWRIIINNKEEEEGEILTGDHDDDDYFIKLHELPELKERYYTIFKKLEKEKKAFLNKIKQKDCIHTAEDQQLIPTSKLEDLCLEEFKLLVNKLENEHKKKKLLLNGGYCLNDIIPSTHQAAALTEEYFDCKFFLNKKILISPSNNSHSVLAWPERMFPLNDADDDDEMKIE